MQTPLPRRIALSVILLALAASANLRAAELPAAVSFTRDVVPVLTKQGCNSGGCHGSFQGRGGLQLSLWGFDPRFDHAALVADARGRRLFPAAPGESLFLRKPTLRSPHGGGRRLSAESEAYQILAAWIRQGCPGPAQSDPQLVRLAVDPPQVRGPAGTTVALTVHAHWSDGQVHDVTRWTSFESSQLHIAEVDSAGRVATHGPGRVSLMLRYGTLVQALPVTIPYTPDPASETIPNPKSKIQNQTIESLVAAQWADLGLTPAPRSSDAEFLRRVFLDTIGTLPTADEARLFLRSADPDKRRKLVDHLLERPEYATYWSLKWSDLLRAHRRGLGEKGLASFQGWLQNAFRTNRPFSDVVHDLLTSTGNLYTNGPVAFYFVDKTPQEFAETTAQIFLGVRMQCARCHHHPFEVWSQDDYYGLAAFFVRFQKKDNKEGGRYGGAQSIALAATGTLPHPETNQPVAPRWLEGTDLTFTADQDPRTALADWLVAPDNRFFARNIANRYWSYFLGRGIVEPVDDMRATNPPSNAALLDFLAADLIEHRFDLKHLIRRIVLSDVYQLASDLAPQRDLEGTFFTHHRPKRLSAEVLLDAINQAAGATEAFTGFPDGTRAIALPDPMIPSYFLETFGRPLRTTTCECERPARPDLRQVLHLANGENLHGKICAERGRLARLLQAARPPVEIVEELYLAALSRPPTPDETAVALRLVSTAPTPKEGFEDLFWAVFNLPEFAFNH